PGNEASGTANAAREKLLSSTKIIAFATKINGREWRVWAIQEERLWEEFRRTRSEKDFIVFVRHVAGMQARAMAADEPYLLALAEAALRKIGANSPPKHRTEGRRHERN